MVPRHRRPWGARRERDVTRVDSSFGRSAVELVTALTKLQTLAADEEITASRTVIDRQSDAIAVVYECQIDRLSDATSRTKTVTYSLDRSPAPTAVA